MSKNHNGGHVSYTWEVSPFWVQLFLSTHHGPFLFLKRSVSFLHNCVFFFSVTSRVNQFHWSTYSIRVYRGGFHGAEGHNEGVSRIWRRPLGNKSSTFSPNCLCISFCIIFYIAMFLLISPLSPLLKFSVFFLFFLLSLSTWMLHPCRAHNYSTPAINLSSLIIHICICIQCRQRKTKPHHTLCHWTSCQVVIIIITAYTVAQYQVWTLVS